MKWHWTLLVAVVVVAAACSGDNASAPTSEPEAPATTVRGTTPESTTTAVPSPATTVTTPDPGEGLEWRGDLRVPEVLADFEIGRVWLNGDPVTVGIADTFELRQQGLMHITDLGDLDGMVFIFEEDSSGGFWMKNTLIQLDIAFFREDGVYVDEFLMEPCVTDRCETYTPGGPYRYALEMAAGSMPDLPLTFSLEEPE